MDKKRSIDEEAERLVQTYADLILRLSYTYLRSTQDAEDICQNVLIKLLGGTHSFQNSQHERAWIIRTTANACKDLLKSGYRRTTAPLEAAAQTPAPDLPDSSVLEAVMELPENYREAIYLHYYEGYTAKEIATLTGRSEDAIAAHLSRGRRKLRTFLEGDSDE